MIAPQKLTCREVIEFLQDYLEGSIPPPVRTAFEAHLAVCAACRGYLQSYSDTIRLARTVAHEWQCEPPPVPDELINAVVESARTQSISSSAGAGREPRLLAKDHHHRSEGQSD